MALQTCSRCIMDSSDPLISFDSQGHCVHCTTYLRNLASASAPAAQMAADWQKMVARMKACGKGKEYDCVLGISGGVDSAYLAHLTQKWGLRCLAVHVDNGWDSEKAVSNIRSACSTFGLDYQSYVLNWDVFREIQLAFLNASIIEAEIPTDVAILGALHQVAASVRVKYILSASNEATEGIMPHGWFYYPKDSTLLKSICRMFGCPSIKGFPTFDFWTEAFYKLLLGIKIVYPLNYLDYSKSEALHFLGEKCQWRDYGGKHHESRYTKFVHGYLHPEKFGIDYRRATLSTLICTNRMTREQALAEIAIPPLDAGQTEAEKAFVAKKLGLSPAQFESIMAAPPRSYRDYPNQEKLLSFIYRIYRRFFSAWS